MTINDHFELCKKSMFRHSFGFIMSKNLIFKVFGIKLLGYTKVCQHFRLLRSKFGVFISKFVTISVF